ncbi:MAG: adenylosuccinate synthase [Bacillota bacterium]
MSAVVVIGTQWGDEGKGKITDYLAHQADVVVRYQGGPNAGHTVVVGEQEYKLHLVPSGIFGPGKLCLIGSGVVIDPERLVKELAYLQDLGIDVSGLRISPSAHLIMPYHVLQDRLDEERKGDNKLGTTGRGVGPAYMDKFARTGLRVQDLLEPEVFLPALEGTIRHKNQLLERVYGTPGFDAQELASKYLEYAEILRPYVTDTSRLINEALDQGLRVLFEGAQGTLLDIDHGTYPFVTSSYPTAGGACIGAGVGPTRISRVIGVAKAYTTRVGDGPFPCELKDATGDLIRTRGHEYGTSTGRPRRVGWLDASILRYSVRVNGLGGLAVTRVDTLGGIEQLRICTGYRYRGQFLAEFPLSLKVLTECQPVYEELPGWDAEFPMVKRQADLPKTCLRYLKRIEELSGCPVMMISIGRERSQTLERMPVF